MIYCSRFVIEGRGSKKEKERERGGESETARETERDRQRDREGETERGERMEQIIESFKDTTGIMKLWSQNWLKIEFWGNKPSSHHSIIATTCSNCEFNVLPCVLGSIFKLFINTTIGIQVSRFSYICVLNNFYMCNMTLKGGLDKTAC